MHVAPDILRYWRPAQPAAAGEILSTDMTRLVVAGPVVNKLWILPVLAAIAAAVGIMRFVVDRAFLIVFLSVLSLVLAPVILPPQQAFAGVGLTIGPTTSAMTLCATIFGPGPTVTSASLIGNDIQQGTFLGGGSTVGFDSGIVLTSGDVTQIPGENDQSIETLGTGNGFSDFSTDLNTAGYQPLTDQAGVTTFDANVLSCEFTLPATSDVKFNFAAGGDEYIDFVNPPSDDLCDDIDNNNNGIIDEGDAGVDDNGDGDIDEAGDGCIFPFNDPFRLAMDGNNIALIPGTSTTISIKNVNPIVNNATYINNVNNNDGITPGAEKLFHLDGITKVITAEAPSLAAGTHNLTMAVADAADHALDYAVFIQAGSVAIPDPCNGQDDNGNDIIDEGVVGTNDDDDTQTDEAGEACPNVSINNVALPEGNSGTTSFNFTVTRTGVDLTVDSSVVFNTADGAATVANDDYESSSGTLNFASGETSKIVTVVVNVDTTVEGDEAFFVNLSDCVNCTMSASQGVGTIVNDDTAPPEGATVTVDNSNPPWGRAISANGTLASSLFVNCVVVSWGDDSPDTIVSGSDISFDSELGFGTWTGASHAYGLPGSNTIIATQGQIDIDPPHDCNTFGSPGSTVVNVKQHGTSLILNAMNNPVVASNVTGSGTLVDADTGNQLEGQLITFDGSGGLGVIPSVVTEGVTFIDPTDVQINPCGSCIPDIIGAISNNVMHLHQEAEIIFPSGTNVVIMTMQDMGDLQFEVEVTDFAGGTFTQSSFGALPDAVDFFITGPSGVNSIRITSITDANGVPLPSATIGISKIRTQDPTSNPVEKLTLDFEDLVPENEVDSDFVDLALSSFGPTLTLAGGTFFSTGTVTAPPTSNLTVQAHYGGNSLYAASDSNIQLYDILSDTWGGLGEPGSVSVTADSGTGINAIICSADQDGDGICDTWEPGSGRIGQQPSYIPTTAGSYDLCIPTPDLSGNTANRLFDCPTKDHKDLYVEIDYMLGHQPLSQAVADVKTAFAGAPITNGDGINGIKLHVLVDEALTHVPSFNVWKDTDLDSSNDFFSVKQNRFGTLSEHGIVLLANNAKLKEGKAQVYHYGLFIHSIGSCGPSGIAELPGNDFIVSLGCGFHGASDGFGGTQGTLQEQKGTLMHELGHNLNLDHGGPREYRTLPVGYSKSGVQTYIVTDGAAGDTSRAFTLAGIKVLTPGASTGTVVMTTKLPFSVDPSTVTVGSVSRTGSGAGVVVNTITPSISGTGTSRLVTLKVTFSTSGATNVDTGNLGTFSVPLTVTVTSALLPASGQSITTPLYSPILKIDISSTQSGSNCKPSYPSVMTYTRQTNDYLGADWILDYSRKTLATINEATPLTELNFFSGDSNTRVVHAYPSGGARAYRTDVTPNMDWNGDNTVSGSSVQDPNYFGINDCLASASRTLQGFEDWHNILYNFRESLAQIDGVYPNPHLVREMNGVIGDQIQDQVAANTETTTASPPGATYDNPQTITLSTEQPATIYYTTDGSEPTRNSAHGSSPVIVISSDTILKYFSVNSQNNAEVIRVESYTIGKSPIGGEILPVDMSVLLVGGAFTNAYWLLPTAGILGALLFAMRMAIVRKTKRQKLK